ncbi:MAG: hypothetical protein ACR5K9_09020 [Wolbachia sp.]
MILAADNWNSIYLDDIIGIRMIGKGGVGMAGDRATWITTKGCFHDTILVGSNHSVHAVVSDTG